jgi:hypothetical protein
MVRYQGLRLGSKNSNQARLKNGYEKRGHGIGVGQINWNDARKRDALRKNLSYPAKAKQYLMIKGAENMLRSGSEGEIRSSSIP